jgi:ribosomal protein S18 acetylase RimI-like enzyme
MNSESFTIRRATLADVDILIAHRRGMFHDMGYHDAAALDAMCAKFRPWLVAKMEAEQYLAWLASPGEDTTITAGAGLWIMDWPPHMVGTQGRRGNVVNVYTAPAYRRQGLARRLMDTILDSCRADSLDVVVLHASKEGRPLYDSIGFTATNEMRLIL